MDFQSAMETFAEAWVAANTGKLGLSSGALVGPLAMAGSSLDLNKAAESIIQQQLGKGVGVFSQSHQPIENGGLDYPKIHPRSITPLGPQLPPGLGGTGMDLSPSSKRIKAFSPSQQAMGPTSGRKQGGPFPDFDFFPGGGHHTASSSSAAAAAAVLVENTHKAAALTAVFGRQGRGGFNPPVMQQGSSNALKSNSQRKKSEGKPARSRQPKKRQEKQVEPQTPPQPKRRRGPRPRGAFEENVPELVLADILDTITTNTHENSQEAEKLIESMVKEYEKIAEGKSLPIHCVIEVSDKDSGTFSGGTSSSGPNHHNGGRDKTPGGKGETGGNPSNGPGSSPTSGMKMVEVDDFVIIPAGTPCFDVVTTVLTLLGYPKDIIQQAEGSILLKNWKPLSLDQVCDSPHKTVGDIFNDLTNHATLRVLVTRPKGGTAEDLKEKLLRLLLAQSSNILMGSGCPLDEVTLGQLVKGQWPQNLAEDVKRRFDQWYTLHQKKLGGGLEHTGMGHPTGSHPLPSSGFNGSNGSPANLSVASSHQLSHLVNGSSLNASVRHHILDKSSYEDDSHSNHPVFHGLTTQKTRMRTSFDPEMELPRLQQWFAENPHPSRHQIQQYVRELNSLDCRKDRKPLDLNNVIYWFKNARASQKRNELRYNGFSPRHGFSHHLHSHVPGSNPHPLGDEGQLQEGHEESEYINENSGSSCRDSSDDHDQEMKDFPQLKMDGEHEEGENKDPLEGGHEECGEINDEIKVVIKEDVTDDDFISVDVELSEGTGGNLNPRSPSGEPESSNNNEEPKDLSGKRDEGLIREENKDVEEEDGKREDLGDRARRHGPLHPQEGGGESNSSSPSVSPRSSPGLSPSHPYDFSGAPSMVNRFHPFFDHPFMAYRHFNSFSFGQNFPGSNGPDPHSPSSYESALGRKGVLPPSGKPSPGMEPFHEYQNGVPIAPSRGSGGSIVSSGNTEHLSRMRGEDLFASRSASNADLISSIINSNRGEFGLTPLNLGSHHQSPNSLGLDERRKRNRTFIDPVTEVPRLEQWFTLNTHPSHNLIQKYTEELNRLPYRQKFPKLECKNIQFWFKNRRAKSKRLKMTL